MRGRETRNASRWTSARVEKKSNEVQTGRDKRESITNRFVFSFYYCLQAQIRDQGIRADERTWVTCVCVGSRARVTVHMSACICVHPPADQSLASTSDRSVAHHVSLFHTQSSPNKADDDNNSWSAKLWMKHPVGSATCVCLHVCARVCVCVSNLKTLFMLGL